jgi:hypothetical protein
VYFGDKQVFTVWGEYDDSLPAQYSANGSILADYRIYGAADGVGGRTENLFDVSDYSIGTTSFITKRITLEPYTTYTMSSNCPTYNMGALIAIGNVGESFTTANNGVYPNHPISRTADSNGELVIGLRTNGSDYTPADYETMLTEGSTAPAEYVPYGYEVDMSVRSANLLDTTTIMVGWWIEPNGIINSNNLGAVSQQIAIVPSKDFIYYYSGLQPYNIRINEYDINGEVLRTLNKDGTFKITFTASPNAAYIVAGVAKKEGITQKDVESYNLEICEGSTPLPYQPYSNITTQIYIGSDPLEEDEYVDYNSGKIYKYKQVHSDTVIIDGIEWDILGYDHDTVYKSDNTLAQHSVTIQAHDVLSDMQFDAKEALFAFDNGLAVGTYHFTVGAQQWYTSDVGKTIQFTLSSAIPAGGQLVVNNTYNATMIGSTISSYASGTATTATEIVTMLEGSSGTDLGTVTTGLSQDGVINSIQRALLGSNNWEKSAIRQYLNSSASAGSVWEPQTKWNRPPSWAANTAGFLNGMSADFMAALGTSSKTTALNTVTDGGDTRTTLDKMFLLSCSEVYADDIVTGGEGSPYKYYSDYSDYQSPSASADSNRIKYRNGAAKYWWLRSPYVGNASYVRSISLTGALSNLGATSSIDVAPACCIPLDDIGKNDWLREKFLKPIDPPVPLPALPTVDGTTITDYAGQSAAVPSRFVAKYRKEDY